MEINNQASQELQRRIYFIVEKLKVMHSEIPEQYQMRIPYELLNALATVLENSSIFEIVLRLMEIQHVTENHLLQLRTQEENKQTAEIQEWRNKIQDPEEMEHILNMMKIKHANELKEINTKLILYLDQKVTDQQSTLERAGVPGFFVTDDPKEITIQMYLLDFILRLTEIKSSQSDGLTE